MTQLKSDEELFVRLRQRDIKVYEECVEKYKNYVGSIIVRQIGNTMEKEDIEEVVSDVFFAIWKQADKINIDNSDSWNLKAYLASIAKKKAINKLRQKSKLNIIPFENNTYKKDSNVSDDYIERQVYENSAGIVQSRYDNPEDYVVNKERMEQVGEAIRALKSPDKDIFMQYHYDGMTINEISSNYGINENTIKSKLLRCRNKVKRYFNAIK